jgi:trans-feruloyl-CoA hydratase/vanillin synthase
MAVKRKSTAKSTGSRKYGDILFEVKDQVAWITINRPRVLNSFREQTLDEMIDALKSTREDPSIVCAVVTGAGEKSFSAGGDFYAMKRLNFTNAYMWNDRMLGLAMTIRGLPIPVIAMVNGWCFGGGYGPLFGCDIAIASDDAQFGLSEINWGILPGGGASKVAQELMPFRKAMYHAMMGENLSGKQAEEQGLITEAVPADKLHARVLEIANVLKKKDGHALRATKWTMRRMVDMTYDNGLEYQIRAQEALHSFGGAAARKEATRQFLDEKSFKPGLETFDVNKVKS